MTEEYICNINNNISFIHMFNILIFHYNNINLYIFSRNYLISIIFIIPDKNKNGFLYPIIKICLVVIRISIKFDNHHSNRMKFYI